MKVSKSAFRRGHVLRGRHYVVLQLADVNSGVLVGFASQVLLANAPEDAASYLVCLVGLVAFYSSQITDVTLLSRLVLNSGYLH